MEDLPIDRDEKVCLEAMFKLKAVVRARGEHKQRIQLNLTMSAVKVIDDTTKVLLKNKFLLKSSFLSIRLKLLLMKLNVYHLLLLIHVINVHLDIFIIQLMIVINFGLLKLNDQQQ